MDLFAKIAAAKAAREAKEKEKENTGGQVAAPVVPETKTASTPVTAPASPFKRPVVKETVAEKPAPSIVTPEKPSTPSALSLPPLAKTTPVAKGTRPVSSGRVVRPVQKSVIKTQKDPIEQVTPEEPIEPAQVTPEVAEVSPPVAQEPPEVPETPKTGLSLPPGSMLARLKSRQVENKKQIENDLSPRASAVTPAAKACVEAGSSYSPEEFMQDWVRLAEEIEHNYQDQYDDDEETGEDRYSADDAETLNLKRAALLQKVTQRIEEIFLNELDELKVEKANDFALKEISQLVKLTFLRVREAPAAYAMLDRVERSALIRGMRAMARKRNSAVKNKAPRAADEYSRALEDIGGNLPDGMLEDASALGFDMSSFLGD